MKKTFLLISILFHSFTYSQEKMESNIAFFKDYQIGVSATNLLSNESMMGNSHNIGHNLHFKLGVLHIHHFTLGVQVGYGGMKVGDTTFYGDFYYTKTKNIGPYVSMYIPLSNDNELEPYISYEYLDYKTKYRSKQMDFESNGLGLGIDYNFKFGEISYLTFGLKYSMQTMNTQTNYEWEAFMNKHNFVSAKIAVTFAKYR